MTETAATATAEEQEQPEQETAESPAEESFIEAAKRDIKARAAKEREQAETPKESDSAEPDTEPVAEEPSPEPEPEPEPEQTESADTQRETLLAKAQAAGIRNDIAEMLAENGLLEDHLNGLRGNYQRVFGLGVEKARQQPVQQENTTEETNEEPVEDEKHPLEELLANEDDFDPADYQFKRGVLEELKALRQQAKQAQDSVQQSEVQKYQERVDNLFTQLGDAYSPVFGKGPTDDPALTPQQALAREELIEDVTTALQRAQKRNQPLALDDAFRLVVERQYGKKETKPSTETEADKPRDTQGRFKAAIPRNVNRTEAERPAPKDAPVPRDKAIERIAGEMRRRGLTY